ncbi:uncharacterized protein LOC124705357 [Lolium rigidum]|uniref:uncharacterized protein LOC124705357 n=1 Tax=Lolium rigidum TaxID=89674 RepID=UPI001F5D0510|nr:uncharacterized protein LOC124705357 [Lolium rigidum]
MGSAGEVVEISSDEEDVPMARKPIDDWLGKLLNDEADEINVDDFSDLMVMGELSAPPVPPQKMAKPGGCADDDDDDDDCVVLDGDPDKAITVREEKGDGGDSSSDELQIVGGKGPVACRDFPHSRHLCSNLPFNTTFHAKHCGMCHCFVCDAPAPCNSWGQGVSLDDHCHATDKESRWKLLRQAFKCKSLPASHPEQRQNAVCPTMSPRHQDIQCQVSVAQSELPLLSNISGSSFAKGSPLLNVMNQNRPRHTSVRVSLNVERTISTQRGSLATRARRMTGNICTSQNTHSRGSFKRVGTVSPGHTIRNANQFGSTASTSIRPLMNKALPHVSQPVEAIPRTNTPHVSQQVQAIQRTNAFGGAVHKNAPQRSLSAPIVQGQLAPSCQVTSNGVHGIGAQLPRCTSLMTQRTQFLPEQVVDVSTQSWQDILASVASEMGVLDDSEYNSSTAESQQPVRTSSQPLDAGANQREEGLHTESVASTLNLMTSNGHGLPSHMTGADIQANTPVQTTQTLYHLNYDSSLGPHEAHLDGGSVSPPADELLAEAAHHRESSGLDSTGLIFDFELEDWT